MSTEAVVRFLAKADADEDLRRRLRASAEGTQEECCRTVVALAADQGYEFTAEELLTTMRSICQPPEGELTDEDLGAVAGGLDVPDPPGRLQQMAVRTFGAAMLAEPVYGVQGIRRRR